MTITYEQIAERALRIWQENGEIEGREQDDWLRAEAELRQEYSKALKVRKISDKHSHRIKSSNRETRSGQKC